MESPKPTKGPVVAASESEPPTSRPGLGMAKREKVRLIGAGALGVVAVVFAVVNLHSVEVNWLLGSWETPLIVVIIVSLLFGMAIDRILVRRSRSAAKRR